MNIISNTTVVIGYKNGIVQSQTLGEQQSLNQRLYDFHTKPIMFLESLPHIQNQFVSVCQQNYIAIWNLDSVVPLKALDFSGFLKNVKKSIE